MFQLVFVVLQVKPIPPARHPSTTLSSSPSKREAGSKSDGKPKLVAPTNTRKIGKKITINLTKGKNNQH